ncbi:1784_t:CDS:2, partial [Cetraspora pellucida]
MRLYKVIIPLHQILPPEYIYQIESYCELEPIITIKNVNIRQLKSYVKQKNKNRQVKNPHSPQNKDTNCIALLDFKLEKSNLTISYLLEINLCFAHNHLLNLVVSFSFYPVSIKTQQQYIDLFHIGYTAALARYLYEDKLHLFASNNNELVCLLVDQVKNPDG